MKLTSWVVLSIAAAAALMLIVGIVRSTAQPAADPVTLAPVRCYETAEDQGLEHLKAMRLCTGATSDAPARCYALASEDVAFSDLQAVRMCKMASSTEPAACALRLEDTTTLSDASIVTYCAATRWPVVAAGASGSPACIEAALAQTLLSDTSAARLCRGSRSTAPVSCYQEGDDRLAISESDLVSLCAPVIFDYGVYGVPLR